MHFKFNILNLMKLKLNNNDKAIKTLINMKLTVNKQ